MSHATRLHEPGIGKPVKIRVAAVVPATGCSPADISDQELGLVDTDQRESAIWVSYPHEIAGETVNLIVCSALQGKAVIQCESRGAEAEARSGQFAARLLVHGTVLVVHALPIITYSEQQLIAGKRIEPKFACRRVGVR